MNELNQLQKLSDPVRAKADQKYHKSKREHWGVTAPLSTEFIRSSLKQLSVNELLNLSKTFWKTDLFDPMICAARILSLPKMGHSEELWQMIKLFLKDVDGWALEDTLAHAAWRCIQKQESRLDELEKWTEHSNFWMRRAALVYTLPYAKPGKNPERMLLWASKYATDSEWFIQKAIGWWLRVLGEHNPDRVIIFLQDHWRKLKGVARKEATRKLKEERFQELIENICTMNLSK
jgi:3-methyladenine DNA glycosylase AlkD